MAIINTFQKCLDSPYLFEDKEAPARIVELLSKAGDRLDAAVNIHTTGQGDPADVIFLSYEAMFCCCCALVYNKGYRENGLRCLLLACEGFMFAPASSMPNTCVNSSSPSGSNCLRPRRLKPHRRSSSAHSNCSIKSRLRDSRG